MFLLAWGLQGRVEFRFMSQNAPQFHPNSTEVLKTSWGNRRFPTILRANTGCKQGAEAFKHEEQTVKHLTDICQQPQGDLELGWALETSHGSSRAHQSAKDIAGSALAQGSFYFEKHHVSGLGFMGFGLGFSL